MRRKNVPTLVIPTGTIEDTNACLDRINDLLREIKPTPGFSPERRDQITEILTQIRNAKDGINRSQANLTEGRQSLFECTSRLVEWWLGRKRE